MNQSSKGYKLKRGDFMGFEVTYKIDNVTGESSVEMDDEFARNLGFSNREEMFTDDLVLDILNEYKKQTGRFPIYRVTIEEDAGSQGEDHKQN